MTNKNSRRLGKNAMLKGEAKNTKAFCQVCGKIARAKYLCFHKGFFKCRSCIMKEPNSRSMASACQIGRYGKTLEQALSKVYTVRAYNIKNGGLTCQIGTPSILAFKKVKLVLVEGDEDEKTS